MRIVSVGGGPGRPVPRDPDEEGRSVARGHRHRAQPRRRHVRLRRRLLRRHARHLRRRRSREPRRHPRALRPLGRHRHPLSRRGRHLDGPRLRRHVAPHAARHLDRARARRSASSCAFEREVGDAELARAVARVRSRRRRRRRQLAACARCCAARSRRTSSRGPIASSGSARRFRSAPSPSTSSRRRRGCFACTRIVTPPNAVDVHRRVHRGDVRAHRARRDRRGRDHRLLRAAVRRRARRPQAPEEPLALAAVSDGALRSLVRSGNVALVGDAVHTAHFSIGSGTKLAMEGAIALAGALQSHATSPRRCRPTKRRTVPRSRALQRAAQVSLQWFEETERYFGALASAAVRLQPADALVAHHAREPEGARSRAHRARRRVVRAGRRRSSRACTHH